MICESEKSLLRSKTRLPLFTILVPPSDPLVPEPAFTPSSLPNCRVPPLMVVVPVCRLAPVRIRVPTSALVSALVVAVEAPAMVSVSPASTSIVAVLPDTIVKLRLVEPDVPVNSSVPPSKIRLAASVDAAPRLLTTPPSATTATLNLPVPPIVTAPVKVLNPVSVNVPLPVLVSPPEPLMTPA